jgi:hypothetical protein
VLYGFQLCCTVSCGLVPTCGFAVIWRSRRRLLGFGNFSPTLVASNLCQVPSIYPLPAAIYLVTKPTVVKIGPSLGPFLQRSLSFGNQSYHCHGRFLVITHPPTLYHLIYHFVYVLHSTKKLHKKSYGHFGGTVTLCPFHSSCC